MLLHKVTFILTDVLPKTLTKVPNVNIGSDHQNILHEYFYYIATLYLGVADKIQKRLPPQYNAGAFFLVP